MHSQKLTHTDLKPENILLYNSSTTTLETTTVTGKVCLLCRREGLQRTFCSSCCACSIPYSNLKVNMPLQPSAVKVLKRPDIRLIDLGSATWEDQYHTRIVSTRHYRAPEVILGKNSYQLLHFQPAVIRVDGTRL